MEDGYQQWVRDNRDHRVVFKEFNLSTLKNNIILISTRQKGVQKSI